ncbi:MAG: hypothetical protein R3253_09620, partial [Longimicrobiales bacterium]|nr:hypothetical protein [Longimicrobiales bacterium]
MTPPSTSRRGFLRAALGVVAAGVAGCSFERREDPDADPSGPGGTSWSGRADGPLLVRRPLVRSFGDAVRIATPLEARPVAYVSMATREVFVDREYRDRASWLLDAHISVSTWVWRIPLPGDSPLTPIPPGDEPREFEELPIGAWDPGAPPTEGDVRIVLGRRVTTRYRLNCVPVQGTNHRVSTDVVEVERCLPGTGEPVREDLFRLAT